jgi:hypothetical protein
LIRLFDCAITQEGWLICPVRLSNGNFAFECFADHPSAGHHPIKGNFLNLGQALEAGMKYAQKQKSDSLNRIYAQ